MADQHVTLDWGTPKVHLASGKKTPLGDEMALCGYVGLGVPREGTEDEVDAEDTCSRCLLSGHYDQAAPSRRGER